MIHLDPAILFLRIYLTETVGQVYKIIAPRFVFWFICFVNNHIIEVQFKRHNIHLFKVYGSMSLILFGRCYNYYHYLISEHFHQLPPPAKKPCIHYSHSLFHLLRAPGNQSPSCLCRVDSLNVSCKLNSAVYGLL